MTEISAHAFLKECLKLRESVTSLPTRYAAINTQQRVYAIHPTNVNTGVARTEKILFPQKVVRNQAFMGDLVSVSSRFIGSFFIALFLFGKLLTNSCGYVANHVPII